MLLARQVMNGALVCVPPETSVAEVAKLMRDHRTGDVLVTEGTRLAGIVTDRDVALRVAAAEHDPRSVPIRNYMTTRVVTGKPEWGVDRVARTMGEHQIRRLPIVDHGKLVGIVSLGDIALHDPHSHLAAHSLMQISEPTANHRRRVFGRRWGVVGTALVLLTGAAAALALSGKSGSIRRDWITEGHARRQIQKAWRARRRR